MLEVASVGWSATTNGTRLGTDGKYPVPMPGKTTKHEYELNIKA